MILCVEESGVVINAVRGCHVLVLRGGEVTHVGGQGANTGELGTVLLIVSKINFQRQSFSQREAALAEGIGVGVGRVVEVGVVLSWKLCSWIADLASAPDVESWAR